ALALETVSNPAWSVRTWVVENGLPSNWICGIAQSPDGYLWVATPAGLSRFDGVRFESHSLRGLPGLGDSSIRIMVPGRDGAMWLGMTEGQVILIKPGGARPQVFTHDLPN